MTLSLILVTLFTGLAAGFLSGLLGVGGGTITIPAMVFILGMTQQNAQAVSLAVIVPTACIGAYGYHIRKNVDVNTGIMLVVGAVVGSAFGSVIACSINSSDLKKVFGIFAVVIAGKILYDVLSGKK